MLALIPTEIWQNAGGDGDNDVGHFIPPAVLKKQAGENKEFRQRWSPTLRI